MWTVGAMLFTKWGVAVIPRLGAVGFRLLSRLRILFMSIETMRTWSLAVEPTCHVFVKETD